jgi:hypothetical protein
MDDPTERLLAGPVLAPGIVDLIELCGEKFDPVFWPSSRPLVGSAWFGHVPFAYWLVTAARPACIVELGTHEGASYAAFCEAVLRGGLDARCFAVDTWTGDPHSGFYGENVFQDFKAFHDSRYAGFSTILRATFDAAAAQFESGSVDLLHIDGLHTYEAVSHDFETWRPRLSARGVVLFHDTAVQGGDFGVHRLWAELRQRFPSFAFEHSCGLGVLAVGDAAPPPVAGLCRLAEPDAARVRTRFARLGQTHELRHVLSRHGILV